MWRIGAVKKRPQVPGGSLDMTVGLVFAGIFTSILATAFFLSNVRPAAAAPGFVAIVCWTAVFRNVRKQNRLGRMPLVLPPAALGWEDSPCFSGEPPQRTTLPDGRVRIGMKRMITQSAVLLIMAFLGIGWVTTIGLWIGIGPGIGFVFPLVFLTVVTGVAFKALREGSQCLRYGETYAVLDQEPLVAGEATRIEIYQGTQTQVSDLTVRLLCKEQDIIPQGKTAATFTEVVQEKTLISGESRSVHPHEAMAAISVKVDRTAPPSMLFRLAAPFASRRDRTRSASGLTSLTLGKSLEWMLEISMRPAKGGKIEATIPVRVAPARSA